MAKDKRIEKFRRSVFAYYKKHGRHTLPWRQTKDPYKVLVSEMMLQQTQVARVIPYYEAWIQKFPTKQALAAASLSDVLRAWQGLGYNRRAKHLREAAKALVQLRRFPRTSKELEKLPGVGKYTSRALLCFSYHDDAVFIETNIRTAVLFHFYPSGTDGRGREISDTHLLKILSDALPKGRGREWHYALMDYGAHLKRKGVRLERKMKGYKKQSTFTGSSREARGAIMKALSEKPHKKEALMRLLGGTRSRQIKTQIEALIEEGMIEENGRGLSLPNS